jgi:hypothetical protein
MKLAPILLGLLAAATGGPVNAESWQATTRLIASSPQSCPKVEFVFQLALEGAQFKGTDPSGKPLESTVAGDGAVVAEYRSGAAGTVRIFGNARARELELTASALTGCRYSLVAGAVQDTSGGNWAIGRWDGHLTRLGGAGGAGNSGLQTEPRAMIVSRTRAGLSCRWSSPASVAMDLARKCRIEAGSISLVTSANSDVELTRSGESSLTGTLVDPDNISAYYGKTKVFLTRTR